jgi:peptidoglycan/LPS O-acetylase OafA/YrhL
MFTPSSAEDVLVPIALFAMSVLIVWIAQLARRHTIQQRAELRRHLLDKFNSGQELTQFLETPQGHNFIKELEIGGRSASSKQRILRSIVTGIVLSMIGAGFLALLHYEHDFIFPGVILLAIGIGFLIAAGVSYWLSKKWGIFEESTIVSQK